LLAHFDHTVDLAYLNFLVEVDFIELAIEFEDFFIAFLLALKVVVDRERDGVVLDCGDVVLEEFELRVVAVV
jgi:hypothetical protein